MTETTKERVHIGLGFSPEFTTVQELRAAIEGVLERERVATILRAYIDGALSPLAVTYADIAAEPGLLDLMMPVSREPDMNGRFVLWEGTERPRRSSMWGSGDNGGQLYRVLQNADGTRVFCRQGRDGWKVCTAKCRDCDGAGWRGEGQARAQCVSCRGAGRNNLNGLPERKIFRRAAAQMGPGVVAQVRLDSAGNTVVRHRRDD